MSLKDDRVNLVVTINGDQARKELGLLDQKSFDLRDKMKGLKKDSAEYVAASKDLKTVQSRMDELKGSIGITGLTTRELNQELKKLTAVRSYLTPGTEAFNTNAQSIVNVKKRIFELNQEIKVGEGFWSKMKTQFVQFGLLAASYLGFQQIVGKIQNLFTANAKLSDSLANVRKTTGLSEEAVNRLNVALSKIDTRTSREELLKLATEAGKLGKDSVEDVARFVKQADIIRVALGEDLGEDAVITIAKLSNIFRTEMLNIASSINSIGQASAASEQYQVDFLSRIAGIAQTAKLSAPDLLGYGAALEINGQSAEKSGTALTNFFIDFVKNTESFGKAAGFANGELTNLLKEKGTNSAFVEFLTKLKEGTKSSQDMLLKLEQLGIDGTRGANVFLALANNIGTVVDQQKLANSSFTEGTSVIKEFNVRNENFAAILEKTQKKIAAWFSGSSLMGGLKDFVAGIYEFISATSEVDKAAASFDAARQAVQSYDSVIPGLIKRYEELKGKSSLTKDEQGELKSIIEKISQLIPTAISQFDQYGLAMDINTTKAKSYGAALREMMEIKNADALKEGRAAIHDLREEIDGLQNSLNSRDANGDLVKTVSTGVQGGMFSAGTKQLETIKLTGEEIIKLQNTLNEKQGKLAGYEALINDLAGVKIYAGQAAKAISGINSNNPADPIVGGVTPTEDDKITKKAIKDLEDLQKKIKEINSEFQKLGMSKDDQQRQDIKDKFQPLIDQAKGHEMVGDPNFLKYREERINLEHQLKIELEQLDEVFRQRDLSELQKAQDIIFEATLNENDKEVNAEAEKWDKLITLANKFGLDEKDLIISKGNAITAIKKKQTLDQLKDKEALNKKELAGEKKKAEDMQKLADVVGDIYGGLFELLGKQQSEYAIFQKGIAYVQQALNTGTAISNAVKSASVLPFPENLLAIATAVANVISLMASAKSMINSAQPPAAPKFEEGGAVVLDGPSHAQGGLNILNSKTNKVVAQSEGGELHVFSKKFVSKNPALVDAIMDASNNNGGVIRRPIWLDAPPKTINMPLVQRASRFEKFENGGRVVEFMPKSDIHEDGKPQDGRIVINNQIELLIQKTNNSIDQLNRHLEKGIPSYMVFSEFDKKQKDWSLIKQKSKISN